MTKKISRLQTVVGLALLLVGMALYVHHVLRHAGEGAGFDVKAALVIAAVGLFLLPFDFSALRSAAGVATKRVSGMFKAQSGGDSPKSGGNS